MVDTTGIEDEQGPEATETEAVDGGTENTEAEAVAVEAAPEAPAEEAVENDAPVEEPAEASDGATDSNAEFDDDEPEVEPTAYRLATRTEERVVDGRIEAADAAL